MKRVHLAAGAGACEAILLLAALLPDRVAGVHGEVALRELLASWQIMQGLEVYLWTRPLLCHIHTCPISIRQCCINLAFYPSLITSRIFIDEHRQQP